MAAIKKKHNLTGARGYGLVMLGCLAIGMVGGLGVGFSELAQGVWRFWIALAAAGLAMAVGLLLCVGWWRQIDEAAREAHKWAWWCGGNIGLASGCVLMLALMYQGDVIGWGQASAADALSAGMAVMLLFPLVGYGVAWAVWWLQRR